MADFGVPEKILSEFLIHSLIRWKTRQDANRCYIFRQRKPPAQVGGIWKSYWICNTCDRIRKSGNRGPVCNLHVQHDGENERILTDPEIGHHPNCIAKTVAEVEAKQLVREGGDKVKNGRKRPLQAYSEAAEEVTKRFRGAQQLEVEEHLPTYEHVRRTYYRLAERSHVPIDDPRHLPIEYQRTTRGRYAERADPFWNERWHLYNRPEPEPMVMIFASDLDLQVLSESHTWIMDGTFKVCPRPGFAQVYTIHGYGRFGHEAVPCVTALLSGKTEEQYRLLFNQLRLALIRRNGAIGALQKILVDYEIACHQAIQQIYPNCEIVGCNFHFGKALAAKMHNEALKERYLRKTLPENHVKCWFGCVKALALLPVQLVPFAWEILRHDLQHILPPTLLQPQDYLRLQNFANYFDNTWINGNQFPLSRWNHFLNGGPRTTNHAEGYHSALNKLVVCEMHLALRNFLEAMQMEHNRVQQRLRKLYANIEQPKASQPLYQRLHNEINTEKAMFLQATGHLWQYNFDAAMLLQNDRNAYDFLVNSIRHYLSVQRYRIGDKESVQ